MNDASEVLRVLYEALEACGQEGLVTGNFGLEVRPTSPSRPRAHAARFARPAHVDSLSKLRRELRLV